MIVLDTHVLLWYAVDDVRLGRRARRRVEKALELSELSVSAISYWEIAMLVEARRVHLAGPPDAFRVEALDGGIAEIAVDGKIAITASRLVGLHGDPADRIIVATALERGAVLITADAKILGMKTGPARIDAQT